jgi:hypothetical protein
MLDPSSPGGFAVPREKEMDTRKIVSMPAALAKAIEDFRFEKRISTEQLIEAGLHAQDRTVKLGSRR